MEQSHPLFDIFPHYFRIYESMPLPWRLRLPVNIYSPNILEKQTAKGWPVTNQCDISNVWIWKYLGDKCFLFLYTWKNKLIKRYVVDFEWNIWLFGWYENYLYSLATEVQIYPLFFLQLSTNVDEDEIVNPSHWHCMTINLPSDKEGVVSGWNF